MKHCVSIPMTKGSKGVWENIQPCGHGTYYTFTVTTAAGTQETADIYGKSAGVNGRRSMVVDFSKTNPSGWDLSRPVTLKRYTDAILWEVHVRDFSNTICLSQYPGKFLAFTERGLRAIQGNIGAIEPLPGAAGEYSSVDFGINRTISLGISQKMCYHIKNAKKGRVNQWRK